MDKKYNNSRNNIINKQTTLITLLLIMSEVINRELFLIIIVFYLAMLILKVGIIKKSININLYLLWIFIIGLTIGLIGLAINNYDIRDVIRDISRFLTPIIFITYGIYARYKKNTSINSIYIAIINASIIIEVRHLLLIFLNIENILNGLTIRGIGGNGSYITTIALIILFFYKNEDILNRIGSKTKKYLITIFLTVLFICYLSRTHLVIFFIGIVTNIFASKNIKFKQLMKFAICSSIIIIISITIIPKHTANKFIEKSLNSFNEISADLNKWDENSINNNWRGYEVYRTKELFKEANIKEILFGFGFGKKVDLNIGIYLGDEKFYSIPVLHNGYYYILLKTGIVGLIIYGIFVVKIILKKYKKIYNDDFESKLLCIIGLAILFSTYVVTGIYNKGSMFIFCLIIGVSFYDENKVKLFC